MYKLDYKYLMDLKYDQRIKTKSWGNINVRQLKGDYYAVSPRDVGPYPMIIDQSNELILVMTTYDGPHFGPDLRETARLGDFLHPYSIDIVAGVWVASDGNSKRLVAPSSDYNSGPIVDSDTLESIHRANNLVNKYVDSWSELYIVPVCRYCNEGNIPHIIAHMERGEVSSRLVSDILSKGTAKEVLLAILIRYLANSFAYADRSNETGDQLASLSWRHRYE